MTTSGMMIVLLLFLQKQNLATAIYLFGLGTLLTGLGLKHMRIRSHHDLAQTLGRCECAAACALAPLGLRIISPLTFYLSFLEAIWTFDKNLAPIFPSHLSTVAPQIFPDPRPPSQRKYM